MEAEAVSEDESSTMSGELSEVECKNQDDSESLKRRLNKVSSELEAACDKNQDDAESIIMHYYYVCCGLHQYY